jgi:hypothetical protein
LLTQSDALNNGANSVLTTQQNQASMSLPVVRALALALCAVTSVVPGRVQAQNGETRPADRPRQQPAQTPADSSKDGPRKIEDFSEAAAALGGPAANPECVWLGRRVVNLLWRDDLDTAFRHLDLYDRFGCPSGHIQATFRCVVRQGNIDPKAPEGLAARIQACWVNPALQTSPATATTTPQSSGTSNP